MKVNFFNQDVRNARMEIRWDESGKTPAVALSPGSTAVFDFDVFRKIPEGASCWIYAYQEGTRLFKNSVLKFKYFSRRGFCGTFKFYMNGNDVALDYYNGVI